MKFWFDTEFYEDGRRIELISIGVVAEDGREYYAETDVSDATASETEWLRENVLPHLRRDAQRPRSVMRRELVEFFGEKPEIWAYYADYDWVALCQLYGSMMELPKGWPMYCRDVKQLLDETGTKPPDNPGEMHNALVDARWNKLAWSQCRRL